MNRRPVTVQTNGAPSVVKGVMLTVLQAAMLLGTDERWVRRRISSHQFPYRKLSGRIVILRSELEAFIADLADLPGCTLREAQANVALRNGDMVRR